LRRFGILLALGCLPLIGLGAIGLVDYDEAAYGEVARAMLASGDWLAPHLCGVPWFEKPPFLYWTAVLGMKLLGVGPAGVRLGTALAGALAPIALFGFARRPLGDRAAFAGALVLASCLEFAALSRLALTDMMLILWLVVCLGALHRAFESHERSHSWLALACLAVALAMLTKGAIGALFAGAVALVELGFRRRLRDALRPSWLALALLVGLGLGVSWYVALGLTQPGGFSFMRALFLEHHVGRFAQPMQGHGGSIFFYVPVLLVGLFPWSAFVPLAVARSDLRAPGERARFLRIFAILSALVIAFFSIAATKLESYIAPALPGLALLVGALLARGGDTRDRAFSNSLRLTLLFVALFALGAALLPLVPDRLPALIGEKPARHPAFANPIDVGSGGLIAGGAAAAGALAAWLFWRGGRPERVLESLAAGALAGYALISVTVLPRIDSHVGAPLRRMAVRAAALAPAGEPVVLLGLRHRPSVCFYGERRTFFTSEGGGQWTRAEVFDNHPGHVGITGEKQLALFPERDQLEILGRDGGYVLFRIPGAASDGAAR
jgi:hypothetical protein